MANQSQLCAAQQVQNSPNCTTSAFTYPELSRLPHAAAGDPNPQPFCGYWCKCEPCMRTLPSVRLCVQAVCLAGAASSQVRRNRPSPAHCRSFLSMQSPVLPLSRLGRAIYPLRSRTFIFACKCKKTARTLLQN